MRDDRVARSPYPLFYSTLKTVFHTVLFITGLPLKEFLWFRSLKSHGREVDEKLFTSDNDLVYSP